MNLCRGSLFAVIAVLTLHSAAISQGETNPPPPPWKSSPLEARLSRIEANHGLTYSQNLLVTKRVARLECLLLGREIPGPINKRLDELERIDRLRVMHPEDKSQGMSSTGPLGKTQGLTSSSSFSSSGLSSPIQVAPGNRFAPAVQSPSVARSPSVSSPYTKREMTVLSPRSRSQGATGFTNSSRGLSPISAAQKQKAAGASSYTQSASSLTSLPISHPSALDNVATISPAGNAGKIGSTVQTFKWNRDESKQYFPDGASIMVDKNSAAAAYDCMKGTAIINASNCDLTFRGSYKQITVRGSNNKLVLHNVSAVALNGNGNTIFWSAESAPKIVDSGTKNSITRRQ